MSQKIRVLVADDSALMRKMLKNILESDPDIEVVASVKNGSDAVEYATENPIDVITMDIEMPVMDGLTALQQIMDKRPTPTLMLSAMDKRHADIVIKSLDHGAVDFISKTSGTLSFDIDTIGKEIISKVKMASSIDVSRVLVRSPAKPPMPATKRNITNRWLIVIGASTGGPRALAEILSSLPRDIPASIVIAQHMPEGFTQSFAERLNSQSSIEVKEAEGGDTLEQGRALVAPGDRHMVVLGDRVALNRKEKVHCVRPSVDVLMNSAAKAHGDKVIGVILTGMGSDGAKGMKAIKAAGGITLAQDEGSCVVYGMPREAIALRAVDHVIPLNGIAAFLMNLMEGVCQ